MPVLSPACEAVRVLPATARLRAQPGQSELPAMGDTESHTYAGSRRMDGCIG
jgi:hypothetical protein